MYNNGITRAEQEYTPRLFIPRFFAGTTPRSREKGHLSQPYTAPSAPPTPKMLYAEIGGEAYPRSASMPSRRPPPSLPARRSPAHVLGTVGREQPTVLGTASHEQSPSVPGMRPPLRARSPSPARLKGTGDDMPGKANDGDTPPVEKQEGSDLAGMLGLGWLF